MAGAELVVVSGFDVDFAGAAIAFDLDLAAGGFDVDEGFFVAAADCAANAERQDVR